MVGDEVEFSCKIQQNPILKEYVAWEVCPSHNSVDCHRISNDHNIIYSALGGDLGRETRYSISNPQTGQYNLKITGVKPEDGGKYRCLSRQMATVLADIQLIVLECTIANISQTPVLEGQSVNMTLQIEYYAEHWLPILKWSKNGKPIASTFGTNSNNTITSVLSIITTYLDNDDLYSVAVSLEESSSHAVLDEANNIRDYTKYYYFESLDVWYSPRNLTIHPYEVVYIPGDVIECTTQANPAPRYRWIDTRTSSVIQEGSNITVTEDMLGGQVYICSAYNQHGLTSSPPINIVVAFERPKPGTVGFEVIHQISILIGLLVISVVGNIISIIWCGRIINMKSKKDVLEQMPGHHKTSDIDDEYLTTAHYEEASPPDHVLPSVYENIYQAPTTQSHSNKNWNKHTCDMHTKAAGDTA